MSTKIYDEKVDVGQDLDAILKRAFVNHLLVYNYCLSFLYRDPEIPFHLLKKKASKYIADNNLSPIVEPAMYNEIYYQFKKFKRNVKVRKHLNDIQYFTFTVGGYNSNNFTVNESLDELFIKDVEGTVKLNVPLPELKDSGTMVYVNLSYSNQEDAYRLNVYLSR